MAGPVFKNCNAEIFLHTNRIIIGRSLAELYDMEIRSPANDQMTVNEIEYHSFRSRKKSDVMPIKIKIKNDTAKR